MKTILRILKWTGILVGTLLLVLCIAVFSMYPRKYDAPQVDLKASTDSAVIARGNYLVNGPAHCAECHMGGTREDIADMMKGKVFPLSGGMPFTLPGAVVHAKNITPDKETGIGRYSDGELARIIRYGVRPDNTGIAPFMSYGDLCDDDLVAIISYLRSMQPVRKLIPQDETGFIMKAILVFFIKPFGPTGPIPKSVMPDTTAAYGKYLSDAVSGCKFCHTKFDPMSGQAAGPDFGGGGETPLISEKSGFVIYSPNLTPDPETGRISGWTSEQFIKRFREGRTQPESIMPWEAFKTYTDQDLKAIYEYLKTIKPVKNEVPFGVQKI